jgi:hypothetical protein
MKLMDFQVEDSEVFLVEEIVEVWKLREIHEKLKVSWRLPRDLPLKKSA